MQTQSPFSPLSALIYRTSKFLTSVGQRKQKREACGLKIATTYLGYFSRSVVFEMLFLFPLALNEKDIYAVDEKRRALRAKKKPVYVIYPVAHKNEPLPTNAM